MATVFKKSYRLTAAGLVFALAALVQFWVGFTFDFKVDLVLLSLIILALFLKFEEVLFFVFLGIWLLNWRIMISLEMIYFLILPLLVFFFSRIMRGRLVLAGFISVAFGMTLFHSLVNFSAFYGSVASMFLVLLPSLAFGLVIFYILGYLFNFEHR